MGTGIAQFATALARAEFGRFYWSDELTKQLAKNRQKRRNSNRKRE
jgi:hypothetical protein